MYIFFFKAFTFVCKSDLIHPYRSFYPLMFGRLLLRISPFLILLWVQCKKEDPKPVPEEVPRFELICNNAYSELEAKLGVFLTDEEGNVRAFKWLPGGDTAHLTIPNVEPGALFDCTVAKITVVDASGSGIRDTSISLTTYTQIGSGQTIHLQSGNYKRSTDLRIQLININSCDSIIVSDGLTYSRPQLANSFFGLYRVQHTGRFWGRIKINGEEKWRYLRFDNINQSEIAAIIDPNLLPTIFAHPKKIKLPFVSAWKYTLDGVENWDQKQFFPLGDLNRAPGGAIPIYDELNVYEPIVNEAFNPEPLPYSGFRIRFSGSGPAPGNEWYESDQLYDSIPKSLSLPDFDAQPLPLSNNRFSGVQFTGDVDVISMVRSGLNAPQVRWEVLMHPTLGAVGYRLPNLPEEIGRYSQVLSSYNFGNSLHTLAQSYQKLEGYDAVIQKIFLNDDIFWQAHAGYSARGR